MNLGHRGENKHTPSGLGIQSTRPRPRQGYNPSTAKGAILDLIFTGIR